MGIQFEGEWLIDNGGNRINIHHISSLSTYHDYGTKSDSVRIKVAGDERPDGHDYNIKYCTADELSRAIENQKRSLR